MFIKLDSMYDFISVFALVANIYILFSLEPTLILGSGLCLFFHDFLKEVTTGWYAPIFKRPNGAMNCSLFNSGGLVDHKSGFPSGHVTSISFLMNMLWLRNKKHNWTSIFMYNFPIVLMGYARIMKGCHNLIQVIAGYVLGYVVAKLLYTYESEIKNMLQKIIKLI
jgi:membrane-associated phospholipid phosphatase